MASQNGIGDEIQALVQALRESQPPADRLSTATRLLELLSAADGGEGGAVGAFVSSGGADVVHMRLHGMHKGWMEEARIGVTSTLEKISMLPALQKRVAALDHELDTAIERAHDKKHGEHGHGHGHGHGHAH